MNDMAQTIVPKSDQQNSDDFLAGPRTIKIREVKIAVGTEQPVAFYFDNDGGKPYLPCKSMRRVVVAIWGPDASAYAGRSMTLYRDPAVTWGGMEVGGIRISHMSHMEKATMVVLTATKKTRKPFNVAPLVAPPEQVNTAPPPQSTRKTVRDLLREKLDACTTQDEVASVADDPQVKAWLANPKLTVDQLGELNNMLAEAYARCSPEEAEMGAANEPEMT